MEPAGGIGHFFGVMPENFKDKTNLYGYELDPLTGGIFKLLYPQAEVKITGYENATEPDNSLDLVVSNVPFGDYKVHDKENKDISRKFTIHNYFIAKSIRKLKPGGVGVFITSSWTMDSAGNEFRKWVSKEGNADFMGAIRLPNTAFKGNAGTEVTTDILIFRKRTGTMPHPAAKPFSSTVKIRTAYDKKSGLDYELSVNVDPEDLGPLPLEVHGLLKDLLLDLAAVMFIEVHQRMYMPAFRGGSNSIKE